MYRTLYAAACLLAGLASATPALAALDGTASLVTADPARGNGSGRYGLDIGGVWDGSQEATASTGDQLRLTLDNATAEAAQGLSVTVTLPAGFQFIAGSASATPTGSGCASTLAQGAQTDNRVTFTLVPADLAAGCSLDLAFGVYADVTVAAGGYPIRYDWAYTDSGGSR